MFVKSRVKSLVWAITPRGGVPLSFINMVKYEPVDRQCLRKRDYENKKEATGIYRAGRLWCIERQGEVRTKSDTAFADSMRCQGKCYAVVVLPNRTGR